jgi:predicted double-glycine peptidase
MAPSIKGKNNKSQGMEIQSNKITQTEIPAVIKNTSIMDPASNKITKN